MPHSWPEGTSLTSSLKRLSVLRTPSSSTTTSSRMMRTRAPLRTTPSDTRQPAILPTLVMSKTCSTLALPRKVSRWSGGSMPESTPFMSSSRS
ncbi:hypothetical protein D3C85_945650 [compost metagenome]